MWRTCDQSPGTALLVVWQRGFLTLDALIAILILVIVALATYVITLHQIIMRKGLPFDARIPNEETISAMAELNAGKGEISTGSTRHTFDQAVMTRK
jgi:RelB antitoxin